MDLISKPGTCCYGALMAVCCLGGLLFSSIYLGALVFGGGGDVWEQTLLCASLAATLTIGFSSVTFAWKSRVLSLFASASALFLAMVFMRVIVLRFTSDTARKFWFGSFPDGSIFILITVLLLAGAIASAVRLRQVNYSKARQR